MLSGFYKLKLPDLNNKHPIELQVNWNPKDEKTNKCQVIKFTWPDGTESYIKKEDLLFFLFSIGSPDEQVKMTPTQVTRVRKFKRMYGIEAKRDIKKGEKINVEIEIPLPDIVDEIIGEVKGRENKTKSGLVVPK